LFGCQGLIIRGARESFIAALLHIFARSKSHTAFEYTGEMILIGKSAFFGYRTYLQRTFCQKLLCFVDSYFNDKLSGRHTVTFGKQLSEINLAYVAFPCQQLVCDAGRGVIVFEIAHGRRKCARHKRSLGAQLMKYIIEDAHDLCVLSPEHKQLFKLLVLLYVSPVILDRYYRYGIAKRFKAGEVYNRKAPGFVLIDGIARSHRHYYGVPGIGYVVLAVLRVCKLTFRAEGQTVISAVMYFFVSALG